MGAGSTKEKEVTLVIIILIIISIEKIDEFCYWKYVKSLKCYDSTYSSARVGEKLTGWILTDFHDD